jgi:DNA replication protein DnaC
MKSDEADLADAYADILTRQAEEQRESVRRMTFRQFIPNADDGSRQRELDEREQAAKRASFAAAVQGNMGRLLSARGDRYRDCTLATFRCDTGPQSLAVEKLRAYCQNINEHANEGTGVFLFGPCGTGKDHLAMAIARAFVLQTSHRVEWASGAMLFEQLRDSFDGKRSEGEVMGGYRNAPLLWLSDPVPVKGELTQYQAEALYRLIDARYNARKPTLVTANLGPGEADGVLGPAIARRLRESTIQVHCNWAPFKK